MCIVLILASGYFTYHFLEQKSYIKAGLSAIVAISLTMLVTS